MNKHILTWNKRLRGKHRDSFKRFVQNCPTKKNDPIAIYLRSDKHTLLYLLKDLQQAANQSNAKYNTMNAS